MPHRQAHLHPTNALAHTALGYSTCTFKDHSKLRPQTWLTQLAELGPGRAMNLEFLLGAGLSWLTETASLWLSQVLFEAPILFLLWKSYSWGH